MNKILVSVYVIAIDKKYDLFIPINLKTDVAIDFIQKSIFELSKENYMIHNEAKLYEVETGCIINKDNIVKFSGMKNGSNLLLI